MSIDLVNLCNDDDKHAVITFFSFGQARSNSFAQYRVEQFKSNIASYGKDYSFSTIVTDGTLKLKSVRDFLDNNGFKFVCRKKGKHSSNLNLFFRDKDVSL